MDSCPIYLAFLIFSYLKHDRELTQLQGLCSPLCLEHLTSVLSLDFVLFYVILSGRATFSRRSSPAILSKVVLPQSLRYIHVTHSLLCLLQHLLFSSSPCIHMCVNVFAANTQIPRSMDLVCFHHCTSSPGTM